MRWQRSTFAVLCLLCGAAALPAAETRYDDVLYLDEWKQPVLYLRTLYRTPITFSRDPRSVRAYLAPGEAVEVVALGETRHYVAARIATGAARGWVDAQALEAPPVGLVDKLRARREKAQAHRELIERHEVTATMTRAEVRASLGKPDRTTRLRTREGEQERWVYTVYRYLPHYAQSHDGNGQLQQVVSYRREPAGHKVITFQNDEVVEIAEEEKESPRLPPTAVVPPAGAIN
ncbi:MAG TPA: hypothetical protein VNL17_02225 [Verrucomicrobiae bacterium]|nr:hypothetical protein [Verrucomicrobiae bacterium]